MFVGIVIASGSSLAAQSQTQYSGANVTGQIVLAGTTNLLQQAQLPLAPQQLRLAGKEGLPHVLRKRLHPPLKPHPLLQVTGSTPSMHSLAVGLTTSNFGLMGISHLDQRQANGGNQLSIEPPSPAIAVGNGFVLQGVNNAVQVYDASGRPLLPSVVSTNQLFGLPAAINRKTGIHGVFPTDMRVFYDPDIRRWFVLQWAQLNDAAGILLNESREWIAVSQTADPTGTYNIYIIDTTDALNFGCPCIPDYPQIGADQNGIYISSNEFGTRSMQFVDATILAISKRSLASDASLPTAYQFVIPFTTGYEFAIQPATTPPGASYFVASQGLEYFVSSLSSFASGNTLAIWAMTNTASLASNNPTLTLIQTTLPTTVYGFPDVANQRPGPIPYGSSLLPAGLMAFLDGGDDRILSLSYAGGRLYTTLASQVIDETGRRLVGGAYFILSPTFRGGVLSASVLRQDYLLVRNNHLLRAAIAVNSNGRGAVVFTLVGPDYYPSAAILPIDTFSTASTIQVTALGSSPEDGFTGYPDAGFVQQGVARWGDDSAAVAGSDGSIWLTTEYIPNAPRTELANWGTFITQYRP